MKYNTLGDTGDVLIDALSTAKGHGAQAKLGDEQSGVA